MYTGFIETKDNEVSILGRTDFWKIPESVIPPDLFPPGFSLEFDIINNNKNSAEAFVNEHPLFCRFFGDLIFQKDEENKVSLFNDDDNSPPESTNKEEEEKLEYIPPITELDEIFVDELTDQEKDFNLDRMIEDFQNNVTI